MAVARFNIVDLHPNPAEDRQHRAVGLGQIFVAAAGDECSLCRTYGVGAVMINEAHDGVEYGPFAMPYIGIGLKE